MFKKFVIAVITFFVIFAITVCAAEYSQNYMTKLGQLTQGWDQKSNKLAETIKSVKTGELTGKAVMENNFADSPLNYPLFTGLKEDLQELLLLQLPDKKTKSLENADNIVTLREDSSWKQLHESVIEAGVYYFTAQKIVQKGFSSFDVKALEAALKLLERGDRSYDFVQTLVTIEGKEEKE